MTVAHTVPVFFDITISVRKVREQRKSSENGTVSNTAERPATAERLAATRFMQASKNQACLGFATSAAKARQRQ